MSDEDKKYKKQGDSGNNERGKAQGNGQERSRTTQTEWDKIDKKGQGAGDRPKRG